MRKAPLYPYKPAARPPRHYINIFIASVAALTGTLFFGGFFGDTSAAVPPAIGLYALLSGLAHGMLLYAVLNAGRDVRVNLYVSLAEWLVRRRLSVNECAAEIFCQALGAVVAALVVYGTVRNTASLLPGLGGTLSNTSVGWAFALQMLSGVFIGWAAGKEAFAQTLGVTVALVFPFVGTSTHNPFRWLSACIIEGTCGVPEAWTFPVGPLVGILVGSVAAKV